MNMLNNVSALRKIQLELKAKKSRWNDYGKFYYRSCEDILEAVKPLLDEHGCDLVISDEVNNIANIAVITAKVIFKDAAGNITEVKAHAGVEPKKGMDISQAFGASSTYARKYALNGLFLIDDTNDADSNEHHQQINNNQQHSQQQRSQQQNTQASKQQSSHQNQSGSYGKRAEGNAPKRSLEEIYQSALNEIQKTTAPKVLDIALGRFAGTKYMKSIENACKARADQMGWEKKGGAAIAPQQQTRH